MAHPEFPELLLDEVRELKEADPETFREVTCLVARILEHQAFREGLLECNILEKGVHLQGEFSERFSKVYAFYKLLRSV